MKDCTKCNKEETVQTVIQCFHDSIITPIHHHPPYRIYKSSSRDKGEFNWQQ